MKEDLVCAKTLKDLRLHGIVCPWIFRLGGCPCVERTHQTWLPMMLPMGSIVFVYEQPIPAGWSSLGWFIVKKGKLFVVSSLLSDNFHDVFGGP